MKHVYLARFEFKKGLAVTIESDALEGVIDAYLVGLAVLEKTFELGHTKPKMNVKHYVLDSERGKISSQISKPSLLNKSAKPKKRRGNNPIP